MINYLCDLPKTTRQPSNPRLIHQNILKFTKNNLSHHSITKDLKLKPPQMIEINKRYQKYLIHNIPHKIQTMQKESSRKLFRNSKEKPLENISPLKLRKSLTSKEKDGRNQTHQKSSKSKDKQILLLSGKKYMHKKIIENESSLKQIPSNEIIISRIVQYSQVNNINSPTTGFWITQNKMVSLFAVTNWKIDKVPVINNPYILPMLGCLTIKNDEKRSQRYIVTELYKSNSLKDILNQFSDLQEITAKSYLRKVVLCISNLHKNKVAHNRLTLEAFITTENGNLLLNMLKASTRSLSQKQKNQNIYYFPPELLLSRVNCDSPKNDIWAIGCIALELLTNSEPKASFYHPYNQFAQSQKTITTKKGSATSISPTSKYMKSLTPTKISRIKSYFNFMKNSEDILQRVKRILESENSTQTPKRGLMCVDLCESIVIREVSPFAEDFIKKCLSIKMQKRPSIEELLQHPFLK